jgi:hypothetical protein
MKGKTLLSLSVFALVILYFANIGAFIVTDVGDDYPGKNQPGNNIVVGSSQSWANVAVWESGTGLVVPIIIFFVIIESIFSASYRKNSKLWKKIVIIVFDFIILFFAFLQLTALASASGKKGWVTPSFSAYYFTYGTTGTVYILYFAVLLLMAGAILMIVEGFKLSSQPPRTEEKVTSTVISKSAPSPVPVKKISTGHRDWITCSHCGTKQFQSNVTCSNCESVFEK